MRLTDQEIDVIKATACRIFGSCPALLSVSSVIQIKVYVSATLALVEDAALWISLRQQRNQLIHEYAEDPERFAEAIVTACRNVEILVATYNRLRNCAMEHMGISEIALPSYLGMPGQNHG